MSGKYTEVTYEQAIARTKLECNLENSSDYDGYIELMLDEALRGIKDLSMMKLHTKEIEVQNNAIKVPCGFMRLTGIWFKDSNNKCFGVPYVDREINDLCGCAYPSLNGVTTGMLNGPYLNFNNTINDDYAYATISYWGIRMNDDDMPVFPERHLRAAVAYAAWKTTRKMAKNQPPQMRRAMNGEAKEFQKEYVLQRPYLRGMAQEEAFAQDRNSIGRTYNAWITRNNPQYNS